MNVSAREGEMEMAVKNPQEPFTRITVEEAAEMMGRQDVVFIDVREPHEYQRGHVPGAKLIPVNSLFARREELPKDKEIVFVCAVGQRSALACEMAAAAGLTRIYNLEGGTEAWIKAGLPIEK
jgi:rhodanese-related sulfurtransferase